MESRTRKRVLIIAYAFWPMNVVGAMRPLQIASGLLKRGYEPIVLTSHPWDSTINDYEFGKEVVEKIKVERVGVFWPVYYMRQMRKAMLSWFERLARKYPQGSLTGLLLQRLIGAANTVLILVDTTLDPLLWGFGVVCGGRRIRKALDIDCIFCTAPPNSSLVSAAILARLTRIPLVADLRDLWTLHEYFESFEGKRRSYVRRKLDKTLEPRVLKQCSYLIYNTVTAKSLMDEKYPQCKQRSAAITNGFPGDTLTDCRSGKSERFVISHLGSLYGDRNPTVFLDGLKRWLDGRSDDPKKNIDVYFVGRGSGAATNMAARYKLNGIVKSEGQRNRGELQKISAETNVFLLCLGYRDASKYVVPAKMYEYIRAGKPIISLASADGEVARLMGELGLDNNVITSPDPEKVKYVLNREYDQWLSGERQFSVPIDIAKRYDYAVIGAEVETAIRFAIEHPLQNQS